MNQSNKKKTLKAKTWEDLQQEPVRPHRQFIRWGFWHLRRSIWFFLSIALLLFTIACIVLGYSKEIITPGLRTKVETVYFKTDGVLDEAWLQTQLPSIRGATLAEIDIFDLKDKLLSHPQVREVVVERALPDDLRITLYEYYPIAKIEGRFPDGMKRKLMVSLEGIVFKGSGFKKEFIKSLPFLTGVTLLKNSQNCLLVKGFEQVCDLILKSREIYYQEFSNWESLDLSSFDGRIGIPWNIITVNSSSSCKIVFSSRDFISQLDRLRKVIEIIDSPLDSIKIDLSLGKDVYVKGLDSSQIQKLTLKYGG